ncbi:MAG: SOS response-associated peptidase [Lachnospiraceae bacterium]|nr:SOS response-associated peptidase [Lachnospiraceae bacterium]
MHQSVTISELVERMPKSLSDKWIQIQGIKTSGEIRPTDVVPVIAPNSHGERAVYPMKWGFVEKTVLFNARVESASKKPTFSEGWKSHRCIIPASYYFEWEHLIGRDGAKKTGAKYMLQPNDSEMTYMCGLYRIEDNLPYFVILTREPGKEIAFIHDRMPVILPEEKIDAWINPEAKPEDVMGDVITDVYYEKVVG